ncbi:hypothetical protein DEJ30_08240 [Curtobacterium sp. MCPF17_003]|uniref:hypothetical protein n=1 Tax=Curtobacterium sp. MCPF17_003 TaxID=2175637 RepID=UPI000D969216|nr:hypothetical protein [Curtobacterium sp. MCPF17_003]PYY64443.1 hypothetical protein DEJ30_08240 [Curtobacterium sp. MCPF17_003]
MDNQSDEELRRFAQQLGNRQIRRRLDIHRSDDEIEALLANPAALRQEHERWKARSSKTERSVEERTVQMVQQHSVGCGPLVVGLLAVVIGVVLGTTYLQSALIEDLVYQGQCSRAVLGAVHCLDQIYAWQPDVGDWLSIGAAVLFFLVALGGLCLMTVPYARNHLRNERARHAGARP